MQKKGILSFLFLISIFTGTAWSQTSGPGDAVETTDRGSINWTSGEIFAAGIGAPPALPVNAAQARAMAERAAFVVALRNLLEIVKGVRVDSESVIDNYLVKSDVIRTRVDGIVKGARIVKTSYLSDGSVEVLVTMPIKGALMDALVPENFGRPQAMQQVPKPLPGVKQPSKPAIPEQPTPVIPSKPEPVKPSPIPSPPEKKTEPSKPVLPSEGGTTAEFKGGVATGLVIDGRGLGLRPALLPKIVDTQGQELYVGQVVTRTNAVEQGVAGYAKDVNAAANNFRVTDNPAIMKGLRASGTARTDVVVGQSDAQTLRQLSAKGDFLQYCRVIIVY